MSVPGADWQIVRSGVTRTVLLLGRWAVKLPCLHFGWRNFLQGLLANIQEREFGAAGWPELCPIVFSVPGGWLLVMPRARPMTAEEFGMLKLDAFTRVPVEAKPNSFGWLDGRIVAIDYGN